MPEYAKEHWRCSILMLRELISFCGRLDQYFAKFATEHLASLITFNQIDELFPCYSLDEQRECVKSWPIERLVKRATGTSIPLTIRKRKPLRYTSEVCG